MLPVKNSKNGRIIHYSFKKNKMQTQVKPWWDEECQKAVDYRRKCYKRLLRCPETIAKSL